MPTTNNVEIITGSTGAVHVTPIDDAVRNSNMGYLDEKVVFDYLENFSARDITANEVRIFSGYGMNQGRLFKIPKNVYQSITIENGRSGYKRADLIVVRYTMDSQTGFESMEMVAITGEHGSSYVDPSYTEGDINGGDDLDDFPLYRVKINGLQIEAVEPLFTPLPDGGRIGEIEAKLESDLIINLASENAGNLDGSEEVEIGVKGILPIAHGGTGKSSNTANSVLVGNGTNAIKNIVSRIGAFFSRSNNGEPEFGTLPVEVGGTGQTTLNALRNVLGLGSDTTNPVPIASGGTNATSASQARTNLGVPPTNHANSATTYGKGNATNYGHLKLSDAIDSASNNADGIAATPKAVKEAKEYVLTQMGQQGYGDMMSGVYCGENGAVIKEKGGTGSTDGSLNGVMLATDGSGTSKKFGYKDDNNVFHSFRQPTGDATAAQVLSGYTFANASSDAVNGGMTNNGAVSQALNCGGSYTVPAGYHNGSGKVTANSLASQTKVDSGKTAVGAGQMLTGYQGWVNGNKVTGTMANKGAWTGATTGSGNVTIPAGYHNGSGYVSGSGAYNAGRTQGQADKKTCDIQLDAWMSGEYIYVSLVYKNTEIAKGYGYAGATVHANCKVSYTNGIEKS